MGIDPRWVLHCFSWVYADIPLKSGLGKHPFRLPSVKCRELWNLDPDFFQMNGQAPPGRVESSGNWVNHPLFKAAGLRAVPMTIYGDAVQYVVSKFGKQDSLMCVFFAFPHRLPIPEGGSSKADLPDWMQDIHVFTVIRKKDLTTATWDKIWEVLVWDMQAMFIGKFPKCRHDGGRFEDGSYSKAMQDQCIAGGSRFAIIQLKQDWEHLCSVYGFKSWSAIEFCPFCEATKEPATWVAGGCKAAWRNTIWTNNELAQALRGNLLLKDGSRSRKMKWPSKLTSATD